MCQYTSALRSKKEIINAMLRLMQSFPFDEILVKQIILESGVSKKTFYRNFDSKNDVLTSFLHIKIEEYVQSLMNCASVNLDSILNVIFTFCNKNKDMLFYLYQNNLIHLVLYELNNTIPTLHRLLISKKNPLFIGIEDSQIDYIIHFNIGAIVNILILWIQSGMRTNLSDIKKCLIKYLNNF